MSTINDGVILVSGGMDSITLMHHLKNEYPESNFHAMNIFYGQRHKQEMKYSKYWAQKLNMPYYKIDLKFIKDMVKNVSAMVADSNIEVPNEEYNPNETPATYVPFRNALFTIVAAMYCECNNLFNIYYAGHKGDKIANYWDCSIEYTNNINRLLAMRNIKLVAPFIEMTKEDIARLSKKYKDLDLSKTWSCYKGNGKIHCGVCATCRERILAMKNAGIVDKTKYNENPYDTLWNMCSI